MNRDSAKKRNVNRSKANKLITCYLNFIPFVLQEGGEPLQPLPAPDIPTTILEEEEEEEKLAPPSVEKSVDTDVEKSVDAVSGGDSSHPSDDSDSDDSDSLCSEGLSLKRAAAGANKRKAVNVSAVTIAIEEAIKSVEDADNVNTKKVERSKSFDARCAYCLCIHFNWSQT